MTDQVVISQLGNGVPAWMSEVTAQKILKSLLNSNKSDVRMEVLVKQLLKVSKPSSSSSSSGDAKAQKDNSKAASDSAKSLKALDAELNNVDRDVSKFGGTMKATGSDVSKSSKAFAMTMGATKVATGLLAETLGMVTGALFSAYKTSIDLNKQGLMVNGTVSGLGDVFGTFAGSARALNLKFDELLEVTGKYTGTINQFGTGNFTNSAKQAIATLNQFGITNQEATAMTADYLETLNQLGMLDRRNSPEQQASMKRQLIETTKWSFILGKSREQMEAQVKAAQQSASAQLYLASATPKQAEAFKTAAKMIGPGAESLLGAITQPIIQGTGVYTDMLKMGGTDAAKALEEWSTAVKNGASGEEQAELLKKLGKSLPVGAFSRLKNQFGVVDDATVHLMTALNQTSAQVDSNTASNKAAGKTTEQRIKAEQGLARVGVVVKNTMTKWSEIFNRAFAQMLSGKTGEKLNNLVVTVANLVGRFADWATDKLAKLLTEGLPFIVEMTTKFVNWISGIPAYIKKFTDEAGSIEWVKMGKDLGSKMAEMASPLFTWLFDKIGDYIEDLISKSKFGRLFESDEHKVKREATEKQDFNLDQSARKAVLAENAASIPKAQPRSLIDTLVGGIPVSPAQQYMDSDEGKAKIAAKKAELVKSTWTDGSPLSETSVGQPKTPTPSQISTTSPESKSDPKSQDTAADKTAADKKKRDQEEKKKQQDDKDDKSDTNSSSALKECIALLNCINSEVSNSNKTLDAIRRLGDRE